MKKLFIIAGIVLANIILFSGLMTVFFSASAWVVGPMFNPESRIQAVKAGNVDIYLIQTEGPLFFLDL